MKLLRYGPTGQEVPALLDTDGTIRDLSGKCEDFQGDAISLEVIEKLRGIDPKTLPELPAGGRIGCPLVDVPNFFCIGLNYAMHAAETGATPPPEPMIFNKATSALCGAYEDLPVPPESTQLDWEVELGFVIGRECRHATPENALSFISAYFTCNDVSERDFQKSRGGQFVKGKSATNFGPIGPYLVTPDEVVDPQNLRVTTMVNGKTMQDSNTSDMIFSVAEIIVNMSKYMTLRTGDIVITGTPSGVGLGMKPPTFLNKGDVVEVEVEGLGAQRATVV